MSNFYPLEVVDRGSETQLQVGENIIYLIQRVQCSSLLAHLFILNLDHAVYFVLDLDTHVRCLEHFFSYFNPIL